MKTLQERLEHHVRTLAGEIGQRHLWRPENLRAAARYIEEEWSRAGLPAEKQEYLIAGESASNLIVEIPGFISSREIVVIGAHYDSVAGSPGANDNASGVAALLEIARTLAGTRPKRTLRLVSFVNEEPPFFQTELMGSRVYARRCRERKERIVAMLSLETIGWYSDASGSQDYPVPLLRQFYPDAGNFLAFVADLRSARLLRRTLRLFRRHGGFPARGLAAPRGFPGIDLSDNWSFRQEGYPALMLTDTALFRYPWYHSPFDTPDKLCYPEMARAVGALIPTVAGLTGALPLAPSHEGRGEC